MPPVAACQYPAGHVLYRRLKKRFPRIVRGEGCWLYDDAGKRYLDASSGALVSNLGHGNAELAKALGEQAARLGYVSGMVFTHDPVEELAAELAALSADGLEKALFLCNGGDAVEAALKISRQFWAESGRPQKRKIVALAPSYHGNTLLAMSVSARPSYRELFRDWLVDVQTAPAPYTYRCSCRGEQADCPTCDGSAVEAAIARAGPEHVAAFIAEPVGGVSTGASVPRPGYWRKIREICDRHEVHFVADEVLVGAGRTGTWSALEPYGVAPDFQIFGKGIAGGYAPLSAMLTSQRIVDVLAAGSGAPLHNQTFSQYPISCAAGLATLRQLKTRGLIERCASLGVVLQQRLAELLDHPHVGDVRGRGLLAGVEFVADKDSRKPFERRLRMVETFAEAAQALGLMVFPNAGQADGTNGDLVLIGPPFIITEDEISELVRLFRIALDTAIGSLGNQIVR
ncbi:MAG: aminotransferase class III-fold pyridoxal phosphate-dependent enzyme [Myxococcales bacterium]|nr:aminotransferase class III-fold pyridoxal phosphate-dependent enzyme [Myxococcales bacterium]MDH5306404.1 aminotransferase class III-fold pyridoxal phosphate-dependent enzyme [Myxococcales bacterium]MDH5565476.1 aminotransferase class III-fold pyridoxal phosphate-dependent enzyme [Myxococcales bacterium]